MFFIQCVIPGTVPIVLVVLALILHIYVVGVDDGQGEVNQGVLFVIGAALDVVVVMNVDKIVAGQARNIERNKIIGGVHHRKTVVGTVDRRGEMLTRPCAQVEVVDEDVMLHAKLGDDNLLILPGTTVGELKVEADHLVLVVSKQLLHILDGGLHRDRLFMYITERPFPLMWVSTT
ncbi:putative calcium-binding protein CML18 [Hordeum vulgare]|nr:putative calcium-binding protein CML18 [Hordeum vulgare]